MTARLDLSLVNDAGEVGRVIDAVEKFGAANGIPAVCALRFGLVLDELISNSFRHGLAGRPDATITLAVTFRDGVLRAELADDGPAFDPVRAEAAAPAGDIGARRAGGLGLTLVRSFADRFDYKRTDGFNRLTIEMKVKAAQSASTGEKAT